MSNRHLFTGLSSHVVRGIEDALEHTCYPAGATIYRRGDPVKNLFLVEEGRVKLTLVSGNGRRALLRWVCRQQIFGLESVLMSWPYTTDAVSSLDSTIAKLPRRDFLRLHGIFPEVKDLVYRQLCAELEENRQFNQMRTALRLDEFLAWMILYLIESDHRRGRKKNRHLSVRQEEFAESAAASRESISRAMVRLQRRGSVVVSRCAIEVLDLELLCSLARRARKMPASSLPDQSCLASEEGCAA